MRSGKIWAIWMSLALAALSLGSQAKAQSGGDFPEKAPARLPLKQLPPDVREAVRQVLLHPVLFIHGPAETFAGDPNLYQWLLDHPDRAVLAWRRLGSPCTEITNKGQGYFASSDDRGDEVHWRSVLENGVLRVWYAEGHVRPAPLLPLVPIRAAVVLRHGNRPDGDDRTLIYHQADIYAQIDSKTAQLVAKMLGASIPRLGEDGIKQIEMFFSGLVWYFDQHPERTKKLLALEGHRDFEECDAPEQKLPAWDK
jgi:hypothetical protein